MPTPKDGESQKDFVARCIPIVLKEGTAKDNKQAAAICYSMYREKDKKSADKVGARHSAIDNQAIQRIHDDACDLGAECKTMTLNEAIGEMMDTKSLIKSMKLHDMSGMEYAIHEGWDVQQCCSVISQVIAMCQDECAEGEVDEAKFLCEIAMSLLDHCKGECQEMMDSMSEGGQLDNYYMSTTIANAAVPAQVKSHDYMIEDKSHGGNLNLSYVKSLGLGTVPVDLACKFVAKDQIKGYSILWGNPNMTDLEVEYFTKETNFWDNKPQWLTWDHAQDEQFKSDPRIGEILEIGDDDWGKWYIAKLKKSEAYRKYLDNLIANKKVGSSSDSAPQYVKRVKTGKSIWLKEWPLFAVSLTDNPCEPRMIGSIDFLKSLGISIPDNQHDWDRDKAILDYYKVKYQIGDR